MAAEHGTTSRYTQGCRCDECRAAQSAYDRKRYAAKAEEIRAYQAAYRKANPDKVAAVYRRWYEKNSELVKARTRAFAQANPQKAREYSARYQAGNPDKHKARQSARRARRLRQFVEEVDTAVVWERDKGVCHICGLPADVNDWHLEHVIPLALGGEHSYANTAVSHPSCNWRKGARITRSIP